MAINLVKSPVLVEMTFLMDGNRGVYMGREFAKTFVCDIPKKDKFHLLRVDPYGKNSELYWEAWQRVLDNCTVNVNGTECTLYVGNGGNDLFAVPPGFDWDSFED